MNNFSNSRCPFLRASPCNLSFRLIVLLSIMANCANCYLLYHHNEGVFTFFANCNLYLSNQGIFLVKFQKKNPKLDKNSAIVTNTDTHFFFNQVLSDIFFTQIYFLLTQLVGFQPLTKQMKPDVGITRKDI